MKEIFNKTLTVFGMILFMHSPASGALAPVGDGAAKDFLIPGLINDVVVAEIFPEIASGQDPFASFNDLCSACLVSWAWNEAVKGIRDGKKGELRKLDQEFTCLLGQTSPAGALFSLCRKGAEDGLAPEKIGAYFWWLVRNKGAQVDKVDRWYKTPLHWASSNGHVDLVEALIAARAGVNVVEIGDETPLHMASMKGHGDVVTTLLAAGADPSAITKYCEETPLHRASVAYVASSKGHLDVVKALLAAGVDPKVKTGTTGKNSARDGKTLLDIAVDNGHTEIAALFRAAIAKREALAGAEES